MRISGLTVCVNYADMLAKSLPLWSRDLDSLIVVTSGTDEATRKLVNADFDAGLWTTDAFTRGGAVFNKGAAISEAVDEMGIGSDWFLLFDSDIEPPRDWLAQVVAADPQPGTIYGARRVQAEGGMIPDGEPAGYFLLFHASDTGAKVRPLVDTHFAHAGCYDSTFLRRWPRDKQAWLPFTVTHHGQPGRNWFGVGREDLMQAMVRERAQRGGWQHETVGWVPGATS